MWGNPGGQAFNGWKKVEGSNGGQSSQLSNGGQGKQNWGNHMNNNPWIDRGSKGFNQGYEGGGNQGFSQGFQQGGNQTVQGFQQEGSKVAQGLQPKQNSIFQGFKQQENEAVKFQQGFSQGFNQGFQQGGNPGGLQESTNNKSPYIEKGERQKEDKKTINWNKLADVMPADEDLKLKVKIMSLTKIKGAPGRPGNYKCMIGDSSASSSAYLPAKIELKEGDYIVLFKAKAYVWKEHIQIKLDSKRGRMDKSRQPVDWVNEKANISIKSWVPID